MRSQADTILYRKGYQGMFPPADHGNGPLRGLVGIELIVLAWLHTPESTRLSMPGVLVGSGNHTIQQEMVSMGVVDQHHNIAWARIFLPPA